MKAWHARNAIAKGKFELAKDVSAFAKADGGPLACGFKAEKKPTELYELTEKETPFDKKLRTTRRTGLVR
ncbi:hypothetical protein [Streptomyces sp. TLI_55]|uniref:hypothetical protein n=1 Tax=Streptomyces sp. TLI_55 TaxID=1938861 RepID=UPI000BE3C26B|nr:hypothetical protein [Streptomyces sp. TLI_55]